MTKPDPVRQNRPKDLQVVPDLAPDLGPPQESWLRATQDAWEAFKRSDVSSVVDLDADRDALVRLFDLYDERRRLTMGMEGPLVEGYKGQPVLNPLLRRIAEVDRQILVLEDRFGRTPRARLALGISVLEANKSLDKLNEQFRQGDE